MMVSCQVSPQNSLDHKCVKAEGDLKYQLVHSLSLQLFYLTSLDSGKKSFPPVHSLHPQPRQPLFVAHLCNSVISRMFSNRLTQHVIFGDWLRH